MSSSIARTGYIPKPPLESSCPNGDTRVGKSCVHWTNRAGSVCLFFLTKMFSIELLMFSNIRDACQESRSGFPKAWFLFRIYWFSQINWRDSMEYDRGGWSCHCLLKGRLFVTQAGPWCLELVTIGSVTSVLFPKWMPHSQVFHV